MKLLLHTCCGPCFLGVWEDLSQKPDIEVTNFFYNPNIWPEEECEKRKQNLRKVSKIAGTQLIEGEYSPEVHAQAIAGKEDNFPGRCLECYKIRLEKTASYAKKSGFDAFSTTLLVSPYQDYDALLRIGNELAEVYGFNFYSADWRPFFREGQKIAQENNIYRQKYCGCKYSAKN